MSRNKPGTSKCCSIHGLTQPASGIWWDSNRHLLTIPTKADPSELVDRGVANLYYFFSSLFSCSIVLSISGLYDHFVQIASETRKCITRGHQNHIQRMDQVAMSDSPPIFSKSFALEYGVCFGTSKYWKGRSRVKVFGAPSFLLCFGTFFAFKKHSGLWSPEYCSLIWGTWHL